MPSRDIGIQILSQDWYLGKLLFYGIIFLIYPAFYLPGKLLQEAARFNLKSYIFLITFATTISTHSQRRNVVLISAVALDLLVFLLIFLNMPNKSTLGPTDEQPLIFNSVVLAIVCAVLMGISDGILFISVVSLLGIIYPENSVESMSLFMFGMSVPLAISFFFSTYIGLFFNLAVLSLFGALGVFAFCLVSSSTDDSTDEGVPEFQQTRL